MKKWIFSISFILFCSFIINSQEMIDHSHSFSEARVFSSDEIGYLNPALVETGYLSVKGMQISGFDKKGREKLLTAFQALEEVVNTEEFKDRIINFKNKSGQRAFASNMGLSNEEIYAIFMEGREVLQPNTPGEMNFYLKQYNRWWSNVIGYTYPTINTIYINKKYFKRNAISGVAGNLAHEWMHKMGFDHKSASEHDSVPYAIGYIVQEMTRSYLARINPSLH